MNHTPTIDGQIVTCDSCEYRAILTNRGVSIRNIGHSPIDHQALLDQQRALAERLLRGLHARWLADRTMPMRQARQLGKYIKAELGL
jgi:hypothetical protein